MSAISGLSRRARTLGLAAYRTLGISFPTVADQFAGQVTVASCDARLAQWSRALLDDVGVTVEVVGREQLEPRGPVIVMSNHQSLYDIPVLFQTIPAPLRMVSKIEIGRVPVWGAAMRASGFIFVDRSNRAEAIKSLNTARERLAEGIAVWIAPEGTRSRDGALGPFKKGGFVLAEELGVPILPVSIDGTAAILPADTWDLVEDRPVRVTIHPRVDPRDHSTRESLMNEVRARIASGLST